VCQDEHHDLAGVVAIEVIDHRQNTLVMARQPSVNLLQKGNPRGNRASRKGHREGLSRAWNEGTKDKATASTPIIRLVLGALMGIDKPASRKSRSDQRSHLIETDYDASFGALPV
jgi:hypothetical protein